MNFNAIILISIETAFAAGVKNPSRERPQRPFKIYTQDNFYGRLTEHPAVRLNRPFETTENNLRTLEGLKDDRIELGDLVKLSDPKILDDLLKQESGGDFESKKREFLEGRAELRSTLKTFHHLLPPLPSAFESKEEADAKIEAFIQAVPSQPYYGADGRAIGKIVHYLRQYMKNPLFRQYAVLRDVLDQAHASWFHINSVNSSFPSIKTSDLVETLRYVEVFGTSHFYQLEMLFANTNRNLFRALDLPVDLTSLQYASYLTALKYLKQTEGVGDVDLQLIEAAIRILSVDRNLEYYRNASKRSPIQVKEELEKL